MKKTLIQMMTTTQLIEILITIKSNKLTYFYLCGQDLTAKEIIKELKKRKTK